MITSVCVVSYSSSVRWHSILKAAGTQWGETEGASWRLRSPRCSAMELLNQSDVKRANEKTSSQRALKSWYIYRTGLGVGGGGGGDISQGADSAARVSSYLTGQSSAPVYETQSWPFREQPVGCLSEQLAVYWLPLLHCQVPRPPAAHQTVPEVATQSREVKGHRNLLTTQLRNTQF